MPTLRNTKPEILAHCEALEARIQQGPDWADVWAKIRATATVVVKEVRLAAIDTYRAGRAARVWYDRVVAELSRPILKP